MLNSVPGVEVCHGTGCVALTVEASPSQRAARVLSPDQAERIGLDLIRQAVHARAAAAETTAG